MNSPTSVNDAFSNSKYLLEAIIKQHALLGFAGELQRTDAGREIAKEYSRKQDIDDTRVEDSFPLIQIKTGVLAMFPLISYLHLLSVSQLYVPGLPNDWNAILATGRKCSDLSGAEAALLLIRLPHAAARPINTREPAWRRRGSSPVPSPGSGRWW